MNFDNIPDYCDQEVFTVCTTCYTVGLLVKDHSRKLGEEVYTYDCNCSDYTSYIVACIKTARAVAHMKTDIKEILGIL